MLCHLHQQKLTRAWQRAWKISSNWWEAETKAAITQTIFTQFQWLMASIGVWIFFKEWADLRMRRMFVYFTENINWSPLYELLHRGRSQCLIFKCFRFVLTSSKKEAMCSLISQYPKALIYWLNFEALGSTTKNHHLKTMARLNQSPFTFKRILSEVNHKIPFTIPLHGWGRVEGEKGWNFVPP